MKKLKSLRCPVFTASFVLVLNIILVIVEMNMYFNSMTYYDDENDIIIKLRYLLIIAFIIGLVSSILLNISLFKKKYIYYITGIIINIIYDLLMSVQIFYFNHKRNVPFLILRYLIQWIQVIILIKYIPYAVLQSIDTSSLKDNLVNAKEQKEEKKEKEERPV